MPPDDIEVPPENDHQLLGLIARDVAYIRERLHEGSIILNNHENAIKGCVTQNMCEKRHNAITGALKWIVGLLVTTFTAIIVAIWETRK